ncbi:ABC transporter permease [Shewanella colwelliana]|uniref:ABC transporter permease n=1 Tax=Shewanella colwelliana TaxID=23 RepID=A0ABQ4NWJ1_SHECO|nr:ABC transporter permease [Shewanella colwelliana]GIU37065.1 ABC transporter permease [Shewanella colwelliana]
MTQAAVDIDWISVSLFMLVLVIPLGISRYFQLGLKRDVAIAVTRMTLQLILVGLYLQFLFDLNSLWLNLAWLSAMMAIGASAIIAGAKLPRQPLMLPIFASLVLALTPILLLLLLWLLQPAPLFSAQYLIPLAGMLLGNSLSGNIIALQRLFSSLEEQRHEYEARLALGASAKQAAWPFLQSALKQSLAPILATMTTTGLVTLPGMMTGQILGGSDPMVAIKYQLIILVAIFVMLSLSVTLALTLTLHTALNASGRVLLKRWG